MSKRQNGTVKWFNDDKGFCFITLQNEGDDLFVYFKAMESESLKSSKEDQSVPRRKCKSRKCDSSLRCGVEEVMRER